MCETRFKNKILSLIKVCCFVYRENFVVLDTQISGVLQLEGAFIYNLKLQYNYFVALTIQYRPDQIPFSL